MKTLTKTLLAVSVCLMAASPAFASHNEEREAKRGQVVQHAQVSKHRSQDRMKAQRLNRQEANRYEQERKELSQLTRRFYRDGHLSEKERRILNRKLHALHLPVKQPSHKQMDKYVKLHHRYGHQERVCKL